MAENLWLQVDFVNTVQFSNHTGYPSWKGEVMNGDQLWDIVEGLQTNGLLYYDYLITGTWPCSSGMCTAERTS